MRVFIDWFNNVWKRPPNLIAAEEQKPQPDAARIVELAVRMRTAIPLFEDLLDGRDYLFGEFGAADVIAFPFLKYAVFGVPRGRRRALPRDPRRAPAARRGLAAPGVGGARRRAPPQLA